MHILLSHRSMVPIYEQIMDAVKNGIIRGELRPSDPLPSVRGLAAELRISALTVKKAYDRLEEEGFIVTVHGKGSFIAETDTGMALEARRREAENALSGAIETVRAAGFSEEEIRELLEILLEEEK